MIDVRSETGLTTLTTEHGIVDLTWCETSLVIDTRWGRAAAAYRRPVSAGAVAVRDHVWTIRLLALALPPILRILRGRTP